MSCEKNKILKSCDCHKEEWQKQKAREEWGVTRELNLRDIEIDKLKKSTDVLYKNKVDNSTFDKVINKVDEEFLNVNTELENKVNKESGKGLSSNDYTANDKEKVANSASELFVTELLETKLDTLISGETIKTINSLSILGKGDIDISVEGALWEKGTGEYSVLIKGTNARAYGEASVAEGDNTVTHSFASHTEGSRTSTGEDAIYAHAEGVLSSARGAASHTEGAWTIANNDAEHAEGRYNVSHTSDSSEYEDPLKTIHSIGIGKASPGFTFENSKNAVEVMLNGDVYINGIGGYDGVDIENTHTLLEVIENKQDTLVSGTTIKTINNLNILGSGNIDIQGGSIDTYIKDAAISQDGNTLTLTKKDDTEVSFTPSGGGSAEGVVRYDIQQDLTDELKQQAKTNIGVDDEIFVAEYGVTTFAEVKEAYDAGKSIKAVQVQDQFVVEGMLTAALESEFIFSGYLFVGIGHVLIVVTLSETSGWAAHNSIPATQDELSGKQDKLISGESIKTINGTPVLGSGDIAIPKGDPGEQGPAGPQGPAGQDGAITEDAPSDGSQYARQDGEWVEMQGGGGGADPEAVHFTPQTLTEAQKEQARENIADTTRRPFGRNMYPEEFVYRDGSHALNADGTWKSGSSTFIFKITKKHDRVRETYKRAFICEGWNESGLVNPVAFSAIKELTQEDVGKYIAVCHTSGYNGPMFSVYAENVWFEDDLTSDEIAKELEVIHSLYRPREYRVNAYTAAQSTFRVSPLIGLHSNYIRHLMSGCDDEQGNQAWVYATEVVKDMQYINQCNLVLHNYVQRYPTTGVTSLYDAFAGCKYLEIADLSLLDTSLVTTMPYMFYGCSSLATLDVSGWDVGSVTSMNYMFSYCTSLTNLDVSGWNVGAVLSMNYMFSNCTSLVTLDVSGWNVGAVTSMSGMFSYCTSLTNLDVSGWNVGAVLSMSSIFSNCTLLTTLIGGSQDLAKVAFSGLKEALALNNTQLDRASLRAVINGLADLTGQTSKTLALGNTLKANLEEEDKQIAASKNWTIA